MMKSLCSLERLTSALCKAESCAVVEAMYRAFETIKQTFDQRRKKFGRARAERHCQS